MIFLNEYPKEQLYLEQSKEYEELTRRIRDKYILTKTGNLLEDEKGPLEEKLSALKDTDNKIALLIKGLNELDWKNPIFQDPNVQYYSLLAVKIGKISTKTFATFNLFYTEIKLLKQEDVCSVSLFIENQINEEAYQTIKSTLKFTKSIDGYHLDDEKLIKWFSMMREESKFEQQFILVPRDTKEALNIRTRLNQTFLNIFSRVDENTIMIPTMGMMQSFIDIACEYPIKILPVLGMSKTIDIKNSVYKGMRDLAIPFPGVSLPKTADTLDANKGSDISYHDFSHSIFSSCIPDSHRKLFCDAYDILKESFEEFALFFKEEVSQIDSMITLDLHKDKFQKLQKLTNHNIFFLVDMDNCYKQKFRQGKTIPITSLDEYFWSCLSFPFSLIEENAYHLVNVFAHNSKVLDFKEKINNAISNLLVLHAKILVEKCLQKDLKKVVNSGPEIFLKVIEKPELQMFVKNLALTTNVLKSMQSAWNNNL